MPIAMAEIEQKQKSLLENDNPTSLSPPHYTLEISV
jgi:hypothetical protein